VSDKLLIEESPLQLLPSLARLVGVEKAIILQQLHWMAKGENSGTWSNHGHKFVWKSASEMRAQYFPFWSVRVISKHTHDLEAMGFLQSVQWHKNKWNRTKFYRIIYDHLDDALWTMDKTSLAENVTENTVQAVIQSNGSNGEMDTTAW